MEWRPDEPVERRLRTAVRDDDRTGYLRALVDSGLVLPISPAAAAGDAPIEWATESFEGRTYAFSFTSTTAMATATGRANAPYRVVAAVDVVYDLPDPSWWLAIDPGMPGQVFLGPEGIQGLREAELAVRPVDAELRAANKTGQADAYLLALLGAEVVVPMVPDGSPSRDMTDPEFAWWLADQDSARPAAIVFTSEARLRATFGEVPWLAVDFADLLSGWEGAVDLSVNPGSGTGARLPFETLRNLAAWLESAQAAIEEATDRAESEPAATEEARERAVERAAADAVRAALAGNLPGRRIAATPMLQVLIPPGYVNTYLEQGHDRIAGLVHRKPEAVETPSALLNRLGLLGDGSPFSVDDSAYVMRWADRAAAEYEIPRMEGVTVPDGAEIYRLDPRGGEEVLARYHVLSRRWVVMG
jgi:hypothetical protein